MSGPPGSSGLRPSAQVASAGAPSEITSLKVTERPFTFRFESADEFVDYFRRWYGPTLKAFAALEPAAQDELHRDLVALTKRFDRLGTGDAIAIPATYAEAIAVTR